MSKLLEDYATRVQYSVFESDMTAEEFKFVRRKIRRMINPDTDNVKFYDLCARCELRVYSLGLDKSYKLPDVIVA